MNQPELFVSSLTLFGQGLEEKVDATFREMKAGYSKQTENMDESQEKELWHSFFSRGRKSVREVGREYLQRKNFRSVFKVVCYRLEVLERREKTIEPRHTTSPNKGTRSHITGKRSLN